MNYIELAFWGITALALVLGVVMGAVRGTNRSVLRLILVLISVVAAFFMKDWLTNIILGIKIGENSIQQIIINQLGPKFAEMGDTVIIMVKVLASVVVFLVAFYLLKLLTWLIVYPLCKLFVKKGKKKHAIIGGVIGLVQGVVIALCICIPLGGVVVQSNKLLAAANEYQQTVATVPTGEYYATAEDGAGDITGGAESTDPSDEPTTGGEGGATEGGETTESGGTSGGETTNPKDDDSSKEGFALPENVTKMMNDFENSFIGKFYTKTLNKPFNWIASSKVEVTNADGKKETKKYTLEGQMEAVVGALHMIEDMSELKNIDWNADFTGDVATQIKDVMDKLDATKGDLSPEAIETINNVAGVLLESMDLPVEVDASKFDLANVNFSKEGTLIVDIVDVANKEEFTGADLKTITDDVSQSTLVMPMLDSVTNPLTIGQDKKQMVEDAFNSEEVKDCDPDVIASLRKLFGLSETSADTPSDTPTDTPTDNPADNPSETPSDTPTENPTDTPVDNPVENPEL